MLLSRATLDANKAKREAIASPPDRSIAIYGYQRDGTRSSATAEHSVTGNKRRPPYRTDEVLAASTTRISGSTWASPSITSSSRS